MEGLRNFAVWLLVFGLVGVYSQRHEELETGEIKTLKHLEDIQGLENLVLKTGANHPNKRIKRLEQVRKRPNVGPAPTPRTEPVQQNIRPRAGQVGTNDRAAAATARANAGARRQ